MNQVTEQLNNKDFFLLHCFLYHPKHFERGFKILLKDNERKFHQPTTDTVHFTLDEITLLFYQQYNLLEKRNDFLSRRVLIELNKKIKEIRGFNEYRRHLYQMAFHYLSLPWYLRPFQRFLKP